MEQKLIRFCCNFFCNLFEMCNTKMSFFFGKKMCHVINFNGIEFAWKITKKNFIYGGGPKKIPEVAQFFKTLQLRYFCVDCLDFLICYAGNK